MTTTTDLERSTFQNRPAYRYIRESDKAPSTEVARSAEDPMILVKLFNPSGVGTWWIAGYDPDTRIAWGVAEIFEREVGSFSMEEIVALRVPPFGLPVERDLYFTPRPMSELFDE